MAINVSQAFHRTSANPVDDTMALTKAQMLTVNDNLMPSKYLTICQDDGFIYLYDKSNTADPETGKFRKFEGGGGGTTYEAGDGIDISDDTISIDPMPAEDMSEVIDEIPSGGSLAVAGYVPLATIISFFGETPPKFFLACDGSTYNKADYPELANHLLSLTTHSQYEVNGDSTKFKVPDLRGEFIRGTGTNGHSGEGSGSAVGVHQAGTREMRLFASDSNTLAYYGASADNNIANADVSTGNVTAGHKLTSTAYTATSATVSYKARPTNTSVMFCIAYKDIYSNPMNDYSATEKVVGTWINGKPVYQKTFEMIVSVDTDKTFKEVSQDISNLNIESIVKLEGVVNNVASLPLVLWSGDTTYLVRVYRNSSLNTIVLTSNRKANDGNVVRITLQYTKTTD